MTKKLEEMTLEERWQLFPIFLVAPRAEWATWFQEERSSLLSLLGEKRCKDISHVGSTAIPAIWAKNIVDILLEVETREDLDDCQSILLQHGWFAMYKEHDRIGLNKGYTQEGFAEKVFHLHVRLVGDRDEVYFRDYLIHHPPIAKDYEALKLNLGEKFQHNRNAYTDAKSDFIRKYTDLAKQEYTKST
ncbi:glutamate-rich protein GrpB [Streptococcus varani]|uniref:Glutamate-rich protein GrpB n=1 Tax=Streptococcus varani TaxID=1608583 RepID=A0A0E4CSC0_9STRE|nr:GrpB family protein [Streptococcus varani]CQR24465.1 glutamate-rich protein GrpB [Streptococcus varani]